MFNSEEDIKLYESNQKHVRRYNSDYVEISGGIYEALFLSQIAYIAARYKYGEFYKPDKYFKETTKLSDRQLKTAKKNLVLRGLISVRYGKSRMTYYKLNIKTINQLLVDNSVWLSTFSDPVEADMNSTYYIHKELLINKQQEESVPSPLNSETEPVVVSETESTKSPLVEIGVSRTVATKLHNEYPMEVILGAIRLCNETPGVVNPAGWVISSIRGGFKVSPIPKGGFVRTTSTIEETEPYLRAADSMVENKSKSPPPAGYLRQLVMASCGRKVNLSG